MKKFLVAIDQSTTSSRTILFDLKGNIRFKSQLEFKQYFPKNGWVEHNPIEIWNTTLKTLKKVIKKVSDLNGNIISLGITNQRETTILWNKKTGKPIYNAIVWQDRRTQKYCEKIKKYENYFRKKTGLFIDPYFSATKIKWILNNVKQAKKLGGGIFNVLKGTLFAGLVFAAAAFFNSKSYQNMIDFTHNTALIMKRNTILRPEINTRLKIPLKNGLSLL